MPGPLLVRHPHRRHVHADDALNDLEPRQREVRVGLRRREEELLRLVEGALRLELLPRGIEAERLGVRGRHRLRGHRGGRRLPRFLGEGLADTEDEPVDGRVDAGGRGDLLPDAEERLVLEDVHRRHAQLEAVSGGPDRRGERELPAERACGRQHLGLADLPRRRGTAVAERPQQAGAGQERHAPRLLERLPEELAHAVQAGIARAVVEVGHGDAQAPRRELRWPHRERHRRGERDGGEPPGRPGPAARLPRPAERREREERLLPVRHSRRGVAGQHPIQDPRQRGGRLRDPGHRPARGHAALAPRVVGEPPREQLVQHHPERVHVGALVHRLAARLLGRHERRRAPAARGVAAEEVGQAEVEDLHAPVLAQEGVRRLEVAVEDAVRVGVGEAAGDVLGHAEPLVERQRSALDPPGQGLPAQELQDEVRTGRAVPHVVQGDDVGVVQPRDRLRLLLDPVGGELASGAVGAQGLQCDVPPQLRVQGLVHRAESTPTDLAADLEAAHPCAGPELLLPGGGDLVRRRLRDLLQQAGQGSGVGDPGGPVVVALLVLPGHARGLAPLRRERTSHVPSRSRPGLKRTVTRRVRTPGAAAGTRHRRVWAARSTAIRSSSAPLTSPTSA